MNDTVNGAPSPAPPAPQDAWPEEKGSRRAPPRRGLGFWLVALLAVLALALAGVQAQRMTVMQEQVARLTDEAVKRSIAAKTASEQTGAELRQTTEQVSLLDARVRDLTAYREQMRDLVQTVVQARDESLLANLDASLLLAQDQAQLTDNPQPMVVALRAAKRRIAQSSDPRLLPVRHALERDLQRLKEVEVPDTAGLLAHIDDALQAIDDLPLSGEVNAQAASPSAATTSEAPAAAEAPWWVRLRIWLADSICGPWCTRDATLGLSAPVQDEAFFLRQNLRLRLLSAKLGLLSRQHQSARSDLAAAVTQLKLAFDGDAEKVATTIAALQQARALTHTSVLPQLDDTLTALGRASALPESD